MGLVDPEYAKTNLLCIWMIKAMELGKSNLRFMLHYRLARFNHYEEETMGQFGLVYKKTTPKRALEFGVISKNLERLWSKAFINFLPTISWNCFTLLYGGPTTLDFLTKVSPTLWPTSSIVYAFNAHMIFEIVNIVHSSHGMSLSLSLNSPTWMLQIGSLPHSKSLTKAFVEDNTDVTHPGQ